MKQKKNNPQNAVGEALNTMQEAPGNGELNQGIELIEGETATLNAKGDKAETENAESKQDGENLMYIGPEIKGLIKHAVVFDKGILPEKVNRAIESYKPMKELFVTLEDMPKSLMEIKFGTGSLAIIYRNVEKRFTQA